MSLQKNLIREEYKKKRQALGSQLVKSLSKKASKLFFDYFDLSDIRTIHIYIPIPSQNEVDTQFIIKRLSTDYPELQVIHPTNSIETEPSDIDMIIVPLICFDKNGNRLGFGGGYYDKLIEKARKVKVNLVVVGLSYEICCTAVELPVERYDQKLDYVVTENKVYKFID